MCRVKKKRKGPKSDKESLRRLAHADKKKYAKQKVAKRFQYRENLVQEAVKGVRQLEKWLLPSAPGYIEAEGGEHCLLQYLHLSTDFDAQVACK